MTFLLIQQFYQCNSNSILTMSSSLMGTAPIHDDVIAIYCVIIAKCEYSHLQSCNPFMMTKRNLLCRRRGRLVRKSPNCHKQLNFHSFLFHMAIFFSFPQHSASIPCFRPGVGTGDATSTGLLPPSRAAPSNGHLQS